LFVELSGKAIAGVGVCFEPCDFDGPNHCPQGTVCAMRPTNHAWCTAPEKTCPIELLTNGVCDDQRGTRLCAGTDPECGE
jgi:hypothetical protein